jgi:hypothetical protein
VNVPPSLSELSALFERLGAQNPESWARSQIEEGIPQLLRFLFLRQAWSYILEEGATSWVDYHIGESVADPRAPYAGVGIALRRAKDAGVSATDLVQIARGAQAELLSQLCYMLEDPGLHGTEVGDVSWGLFETDEEGNPIQPINGLHESVLETDPTGREMRPADAA